MPPKGSRKRAASEEYEADGGFVEDVPKTKKTKAAAVKEAKPKSSAKSEEAESPYWEVGEQPVLCSKTKLTWTTSSDALAAFRSMSSRASS